MNLEKIIEWGAIFLVVILGARWLAGLFGTGDPVQSTGPQMYTPGWSGTIPYGTGYVMFSPGMVGNFPERYVNVARGRGRRR